MNNKQLMDSIMKVRSSATELLDFVTMRTLKDLEELRYCKNFDLINPIVDESRIIDLTNFFILFNPVPGIYLFEVNVSEYYSKWASDKSKYNQEELKKEWLRELKQMWSGVKISPQFYKKRALVHIVNDGHNKFRDGWVPLYVGKSKNAQARIWEHIEGNSTQTYGMKLKRRENLKGNVTFRVSYSPLYNFEDEIMYELVKVIENRVRDKYQPFIGKK
jgi:hypothetical protein